VKIAAQTRTELVPVARLIDGIPIAMLTTIEDDGALASRPMLALELDALGALWFYMDIQSPVVLHLRAVNLSFTNIARGIYVSMSGRGEIDTDPGRMQRLWTTLAESWFPEGSDAPHLALLKFVPDSVDRWDLPGKGMVRAFGAMADVAAGQVALPSGRGSHAGLTASAANGPFGG
jgi:general stress protein 26